MGFLRCGRAEDAAEASTSGRPAEAQGGCCAKPPPAKARQGGGGSRSGSDSDSDDDVSLLSGSSASEASAVDAAMNFFGAAPQQARVCLRFRQHLLAAARTSVARRRAARVWVPPSGRPRTLRRAAPSWRRVCSLGAARAPRSHTRARFREALANGNTPPARARATPNA
jgi:hypothetical protein